MLTEAYAVCAARLPASAAHAMLGLNALPVRAIVVIVIHVPMLGRVLRRSCVVWGDLCHDAPLSICDIAWKYTIESSPVSALGVLRPERRLDSKLVPMNEHEAGGERLAFPTTF